jgi:transcriptional regulator with XRE-family HTH domain
LREDVLRELRNIRLRGGLSQADLSAITGVAEFTISEIEAGKRTPRPSTLRKLAQGLGVEVSDFYEGADSPLAEAPPSPEQPPLNGFLAEERREAEERALASMTALAEDGERLVENLKAVGENIPASDAFRFIVAENLARLFYEEWSLNRQASAELRDAKGRLDDVGQRIDSLLHQLIRPGSTAAARERNLFASLRAEHHRQETERQAERVRKDETA